jgi:2-polyprenyl-6-methoxyphenol hydroxylase-like FAD-dependent oxidoreductase
LELFGEIDIADSFVDKGIKIRKGHAFANAKKLGTLSFEGCPRPFNYILALPQHKTEKILESKLVEFNPNSLKRGAEVINIAQDKTQVKVSYRIDGQTRCATALYLAGCDGKDSFVRNSAGISFEGKAYPDTYIMGDFSDNTHFGSDAAIFLCDEGLIESFPLLNNRRRWVIKTDNYFSLVKRKDIETRIRQRIGHNLRDTENIMLSSFGVQKFIARPMVKNRIILAGDAAHIVSPIGGQGMNLGWLGTWDLAHCLKKIIHHKQQADILLQEFKQRRNKAAKNAIRRGEINMRLGRQTSVPAFRNGIVSFMLNTPLSNLMAKAFTMRGVENWIF